VITSSRANIAVHLRGPPIYRTFHTPGAGAPTGGQTSPLKGLWTHQKGGFFHDGRFATLEDVIAHYDSFFNLRLTNREKRDLAEYLKSL
jgi:hypothetical protein